MNITYPSDLSDAEWTCVQRHLPPLSRRGRPRTHPWRCILDAIFCVLRTGCAWRYLPCNFPPWQTVFYHFRRFRLQGKWHLLYTALHRAERERVGRHPDPSAAIMDSQSVKTVEESGGIRGYDAHKRVKGRKRHLLVDTLGLPIACYITPADVHDTVGARKVLGGLAYFVPRLKRIWADAAYRGQELAEWCK
jgi:putative transposase